MAFAAMALIGGCTSRVSTADDAVMAVYVPLTGDSLGAAKQYSSLIECHGKEPCAEGVLSAVADSTIVVDSFTLETGAIMFIASAATSLDRDVLLSILVEHAAALPKPAEPIVLTGRGIRDFCETRPACALAAIPRENCWRRCWFTADAATTPPHRPSGRMI